MSEVKTNKISPRSGTSLTVGDSGDTTTMQGNVNITAGAIAPAALTASNITINGSSVNLGGSVTIPTEDNPAVTSAFSPAVITTSTQTEVTITGTGFVSIPLVTAVNSSTGASIVADTVTFTSATQIKAKFTIAVNGDYKLYIENPDGNATLSTQLLGVSTGVAYSTAAGSLGTFAAGSTISVNVVATSDSAITFSKSSGNFPGGLSLTPSTGVISGTESGSTANESFSFELTATDAEGQTAARTFSIAITVGINNSGQFN
jgi:hypothetical protein